MPQNKTKSGSFQNYLNRQDRSGLDPLDTSRTAASIEGWFLRRLFTFSLRTRNVFSLFVMFVFGASATGLMGFAFYGLRTTRPGIELDFMGYLMFAGLYLIFGIVFLIGIALLINLGINLEIVLGLVQDKPENEEGSRPNKPKKKKTPKRRKDFK